MKHNCTPDPDPWRQSLVETMMKFVNEGKDFTSADVVEATEARTGKRRPRRSRFLPAIRDLLRSGVVVEKRFVWRPRISGGGSEPIQLYGPGNI